MTNLHERFKQIENFPDYLVSENGIVKNKDGEIINPYLRKDGYIHVYLKNSMERKAYLVHRLVAETFIWNKENKPQVNHKDGNKANPELSNLEWCTNSENMLHAFNTGLKNSEHQEGSRNSQSKLIVKDIITIRKLNSDGVSQTKLSKKYNVSQSLIHQIVSYKLWKHIA